ncbi:MAG: DNA repair protein RadC [Polyangiaceae bacterium]
MDRQQGWNGPRERAASDGVAALGDAELIAVVLGAGSRGNPVGALSSRLLEDLGGLEAVARLAPRALAAHPGLGPAKAARLAAAVELGRRACERAARPRQPMCSAAAVAAWFASRLGPLDHEEMWVVALDGRNGLRGARRVAQGGLHGCSVAARDILRGALAQAASALVLVHNHPSGDPTPSPEDVLMTRTVAEAAEVIGTPLVDHVIVAAGGSFASMLEMGLLDGGDS